MTLFLARTAAYRRSIAGPADPNWATVFSLLHMNGANDSTAFTDQRGATWTVGGGAQISTAQSKFGGASGSFNGTDAYIRSTFTTPIAAGEDVTLECWVYPTSVASGYKTIWHVSGRALYLKGNTFLWYSGGDCCVSAAVTTGAWYHVAVVRNAGVFSVYVNGVASSSTFTDSTAFPSGITTLAANAAGTERFAGYLDDVRMSRGIARYTSNFTPPTDSFPNH